MGTVEASTPTWASQSCSLHDSESTYRAKQAAACQDTGDQTQLLDALGTHTGMILQNQGARVWAPWKVPRPHGPASHAASMLLRLPTRPSRPPNAKRKKTKGSYCTHSACTHR